MPASLPQILWEQNLDLADACLEHRFVTGIAAGILEAEVFRTYVAQDACFLDSFARAYALAAARCRSLEDIHAFHGLLGGVIEEKRLHQSYAETLRISLRDVLPNWACKAYTDFLLRTAWNSGLDEILAAMTPCMKLYTYLGAELAASGLPDHQYRDWVATYSSNEFSGLTRKIEDLLNEQAADTQRVRDAYRYAMTCELDFFSAVFEEHDGGMR